MKSMRGCAVPVTLAVDAVVSVNLPDKISSKDDLPAPIEKNAQ